MSKKDEERQARLRMIWISRWRQVSPYAEISPCRHHFEVTETTAAEWPELKFYECKHSPCLAAVWATGE